MHSTTITTTTTTLTNAVKIEVGLLCWTYFFLFREGCRSCGFHIRKNTGTTYDLYLVLSDNDIASTGIFVKQD